MIMTDSYATINNITYNMKPSRTIIATTFYYSKFIVRHYLGGFYGLYEK